ncbi:MAG: Ig-like domain-containing protein [Acidobacteriia bacterium]|nr:Ig-like domain-containing protein [Terriglobia bacterium]
MLRPLGLAAASLTVVLGLSASSIVAPITSSQSSPQSSEHSQKLHRMPKSPVPQQLLCGLWRTDHTFEATLRIKNELLTDPLSVTPVLFMADGTEYDLPPVTIGSADVVSVEINAALRAAPAWLRPHISEFGSALLRFEWNWNAVSGLVQNLDKIRSLTYLYPFQNFSAMEVGHDMEGGSADHQVIEGLWWKHDDAVDGYVAISNTTGQNLDVNFAVSDSQGLRGPRRTITLLGHATHVVRLSELQMNRTGGPEAQSSVDSHTFRRDDQRGGITVSYDGAPGAILLSGGLENAAEGFSAPIVFRSVRQHTASDEPWRSASVGIMVGIPDPMMEFPSGTRFTPYTILRNGDSKPITVRPGLFYMLGMETKQAPVPSFQLLPHQTIALDINALLAAAGVKNYSGMVNLEFSYLGNVGALMVATGSVDQTGSYVFDVSAKGINRDRGKRVSYWDHDGSTDTMFTLWNPDGTAEDLLVILYFHGGAYKVPAHLDAFGTATFNISELAMEQKPDSDGHFLPQDAQVGSALIIDASDRRHQVEVVVSVGTFNVETATCGENLCINCDDIIGLLLSPDPFGLPFNAGKQMSSRVTFTDNTTMDYTTQTPWESSNTSIATVNSAGFANGLGVGTTAISALLDVTVEGSQCFVSGICDNSTVGDETPTTVNIMGTLALDTASFTTQVAGGTATFTAVVTIDPAPASAFPITFTVQQSAPTNTANVSLIQGAQAASHTCSITSTAGNCQVQFPVSSSPSNTASGTVSWRFTVSPDKANVTITPAPNPLRGTVAFQN